VSKNVFYRIIISGAMFVIGLARCAPEGGVFLNSTLNASSSSTDYSGYVVVSNATTRSVVLLDSTLTYVRDLAVFPTGTTPRGVGVFSGNTIMISIDTVDRVATVDISVGSSSLSHVIIDSNLSGTINGVTRISGGDILVIETNNVERYNSSGTRQTLVNGVAWPQSLGNTGTEIAATPSGGFVFCSTGADRVQTYTSDAVLIGDPGASGIAGTTDASACAAGSDGRIAVAWHGTTDTIRVYSGESMGTLSFSYSDTVQLGNPTAMAFRPNGNLLVIDGTSNTVVELSTSGSVVATYTSSAISGANRMLVMP
jgi:hypothetical protein